MVWFFERASQGLRLETRFDNTTREYVVDIAWPDRPPETERYADVAGFRARMILLEETLVKEDWRQVGSPEILPEGWRGPIAH